MKKSLSLAVAALVTSLCFSGAAFAQDITKLRVGYIPVGVYSYFWHAQDAGYFADEGLEVELVPMAGGGEIIPALVSDSLQFGISDALGVINARNAGIPVSYISFNYSEATTNADHTVMTMAPDVKDVSDLSGKAVATNLSYNTDWVMMRKWLQQNGVDINTVDFREVPFPDMLSAMRNETIAAAGLIEPFVTMAKKEGAVVLGHSFADVKSPIPYTGIIAEQSYIDENPDIANRFKRAIGRALDDYQDINLVRKTVKEHTKIAPEIVDTMVFGIWSKDIDPSEIKFWVDAAKQEGILDSDIDLSLLIWNN